MDDPGVGDPGMDEPAMDEYARTPLYCSTGAIEGASPNMAWRVDIVPGGRCHEMTLRYEVAGHHPGPAIPAEVIEESVVVGPVAVDRVEVSTGDATLAVSGIDAHPGLWTGALTRAGEEHAVACYSSIWQPRYQYDSARGMCLDSSGAEGLNPAPVPVVRDSGMGQCADLRGQMLNENDLSYPEWRGFDLRGADLRDAELIFALIHDAQLEGADMGTMHYGYASITGTIDEYTIVPTDGCTAVQGTLDCVM